jgi:uncharacterized protein (DUF4415 family)
MLLRRGISLQRHRQPRGFCAGTLGKDVLPPGLYQAAVKRYRGQRGPQKTPVKQDIKLRIDPDILASFRATGPGWQSRINDALRRALADLTASRKSPKADAVPKRQKPHQTLTEGPPISVQEGTASPEFVNSRTER